MAARIARGEVGIRAATATLASGELVALPTETVYGLGAKALDPAACVKIFEAKGRPLHDPLIVHVPDPGWLDRLALGNPLAERLAEAFWPGPLTMVLPRREIVPDLVTAGQETVALRMSAHPVFREVALALAEPIAAPSANRFGRVSPTRPEHVLEELGDRIALVLDGGPCEHGIESTIVWVREHALHILRQGPIPASQLTRFAPLASAPREPAAPGSLKSHYAPATPLEILPPDQTPIPHPRRALLAWKKPVTGFAACEILTPRGEPAEAARNLYHALRTLDASDAELILVEHPPPGELASAIADRLARAAAR